MQGRTNAVGISSGAGRNPGATGDREQSRKDERGNAPHARCSPPSAAAARRIPRGVPTRVCPMIVGLLRWFRGEYVRRSRTSWRGLCRWDSRSAPAHVTVGRTRSAARDICSLISFIRLSCSSKNDSAMAFAPALAYGANPVPTKRRTTIGIFCASAVSGRLTDGVGCEHRRRTRRGSARRSPADLSPVRSPTHRARPDADSDLRHSRRARGPSCSRPRSSHAASSNARSTMPSISVPSGAVHVTGVSRRHAPRISAARARTSSSCACSRSTTARRGSRLVVAEPENARLDCRELVEHRRVAPNAACASSAWTSRPKPVPPGRSRSPRLARSRTRDQSDVESKSEAGNSSPAFEARTPRPSRRPSTAPRPGARVVAREVPAVVPAPPVRDRRSSARP